MLRTYAACAQAHRHRSPAGPAPIQYKAGRRGLAQRSLPGDFSAQNSGELPRQTICRRSRDSDITQESGLSLQAWRPSSGARSIPVYSRFGTLNEPAAALCFNMSFSPVANTTSQRDIDETADRSSELLSESQTPVKIARALLRAQQIRLTLLDTGADSTIVYEK